MKVVVAIDSLKGSLSSLEAGTAISEGIHRVYKDADVMVRPLADGGEGTVEALALGMGGRLEKVIVTGPLSNKVEAVYGIVDCTKTAIVEMSAAAGITLLNNEERNPLETTTYGVGEIIRDAISKGCRSFIVGIGGSATNDGGIGMLQALGFDFLDKNGNQVALGAKGLKDIEEINDKHVIKELKDCHFKVACDVTNTLCGENGCSAIFGPQKGATPAMILQMDKWLTSYAQLTKEICPESEMNYPGTGAAGGLGFAFQSYLKATLESGIKIVLDETKLEEYVKDADLVVTGEGRLDSQTVFGKAPIGVAGIAKKYNKSVIAFSGCVAEDATLCNQHGIDAFFPILRGIVTLSEAMNPENARANLIASVEQVFRLISLYGEKKHLPVFGIGPILCFPMVIISAIAIYLSKKGLVPFVIESNAIRRIFIVLGVVLIVEGLVCFIGADFGGGLIKSIKSNQLKTNGSYAFVRNPCYAVYFLGSTGALLIAHNPVLLILPLLFWLVMTVVLKNTEEKWLKELYGQEYIEYCKVVNRCIPWFPKK